MCAQRLRVSVAGSSPGAGQYVRASLDSLREGRTFLPGGDNEWTGEAATMFESAEWVERFPVWFDGSGDALSRPGYNVARARRWPNC
jgi:hypothetical protein